MSDEHNNKHAGTGQNDVTHGGTVSMSDGPLPPRMELPVTTPVPPLHESYNASVPRPAFAGYEERTVINNGIQSTIRNPVSATAPSGRDRSGDHHMELPNGFTGGSAVESSVSGVRVGNETYTVRATKFTGGLSDGSTYLGISNDKDRIDDIVTLDENTMSPELKAKVITALSKSSQGGTALTYEEARKLIVNVLPDVPVRVGHDGQHQHDGTNPNVHLQGNAPTAARSAGAGRGGDQ